MTTELLCCPSRVPKVLSAAGKPRHLCDNRDPINQGRAYIQVWQLSLQEEHLPSSHVHLAVGTPQYHMTWADKSARLCREHATVAHTNTRARAAMVVLYYACGAAIATAA